MKPTLRDPSLRQAYVQDDEVRGIAMKKYKYFTIRQAAEEQFNKRPVYRIFNNKSEDEIGLISWYSPWRKFVFCPHPTERTVFSEDCLLNVIDFIMHHAGK
jgi:hypothetical protein